MKKYISILITVLIFSAVFYAVPAFAAVDPYAGFNAVEFDGSKVGNTFQMNNGGLGGMYNSHYVYYKDIEFGETAPVSVTVSIGVPADYVGRIELCLDSPNNPAIASIVPVACNWTTPLPNTVELTQKITGKHDLYIVVKDKTCDIYSVKFNLPATEGIYQEYRENDQYNDITGNPYQKEILLITALGLMDGEEENIFNPNMVVTRGQFADYLRRIFWDLPFEYREYYSDVSADSPFSESVCILAHSGILDTTVSQFRPYAYITPFEAAEMIVGVLGYKELLKADKKQAYNIIASESLTAGFFEEYLRRDTCAAILYRALQADYTDVNKIGNSVTYQKKTDGILNYTRGISKGKGFVNKNCLTGLYSPESELKQGTVSINDIVFSEADTRASSYLGYECEYFYTTDTNGNKTLVAVCPTKNMETLFVDGNNVKTLSSKMLEYTNENEKEKKITFKATTKFIYNGKALDDELSNVITSSRFHGEVRLVAYNGSYDTVFINAYSNVIISGVDSNGLLHDELSGKSFDLEANELVLQRDGNNVVSGEIEPGDAGVVYASVNKTGEKLVRAYFRSDKLSGTITASEEVKGTKTLWIDDEPYIVAAESKADYEVCTYANFYVNIYDEILSYTLENIDGIKIGFMVAHEKETAGFEEDGFGIKLIDESCNELVLRTAKNIVIDGVKCKSKTDFVSALSSVDMNTPVRYSLNSDGLVRMLDTYRTNADNFNDTLIRLTSSPVDFIYSKANRLLMLYGSGRGAYALKKEAKVFSLWAGCEIEDMTMGDLNDLSGDGIKSGIAYSLNGDENIGDIFVWSNRQAEWEYPFIYETKTIVAMENDEIFYKLIGYRGVSQVEYLISKDILDSNRNMKTIIDKLSEGDIIRVCLNGSGYVCNTELIFLHDAREKLTDDISPLISEKTVLSGDSLQYHRFLYSTVVGKSDGYLKVTYNDSTEKVSELINVEGVGACAFVTSETPAYLVKGLDYANINVGDKIFTYGRNAATKLIVIYEHNHTAANQ